MKKTLSYVLVLLTALIISGCNSRDRALTDPETLIDSLISNVSFEGNLGKLDDKDVKFFFDIQDNVNAIVYRDSGVLSDEIAVFVSSDEAETEETLSAVHLYVKDKIFAIEDYQPDEAEKLKNAVIFREGRYVVLCVSNDSDTAKKIINDAFK